MKVNEEKVLVACSKCLGEGAVELTGVFAETLELLRKTNGTGDRAGKKAASTTMLAGIVKVSASAMGNRLAWLQSHGLVVSLKYGRERWWSLPPKETKDEPKTGRVLGGYDWSKS